MKTVCFAWEHIYLEWGVELKSAKHEIQDIRSKKISVPNKGMKKEGESLSYFVEEFQYRPTKMVEEYYPCMNKILSVLRSIGKASIKKEKASIRKDKSSG